MSNPFSLAGKRVLITGASSGIGAETAIQVAQAGAFVILTGRDTEKLQKTADVIHSENCSVIQADLITETEKVIDSCGPLDGLVHCAGISGHVPIKFLDQKKMDAYFKINFEAPVLLVNQLFKQKKINKGASLVFISSLASKFPFKGGTYYSGSKAALDNFSKVIALEMAPNKVRSNTIHPGMVKTPMLDYIQENITEETMKEHEKLYPLGFGEPKDVANTAIFLLSDASCWITGTGIILDGGLTAGT